MVRGRESKHELDVEFLIMRWESLKYGKLTTRERERGRGKREERERERNTERDQGLKKKKNQKLMTFSDVCWNCKK